MVKNGNALFKKMIKFLAFTSWEDAAVVFSLRDLRPAVIALTLHVTVTDSPFSTLTLAGISRSESEEVLEYEFYVKDLWVLK